MYGLAAATYFITIDDGTYKEDDWSSTNYGAKKYSNGMTVNEDGTLNVDKSKILSDETTSGESTSDEMTIQELWDEMLLNGSRVDKYLSSPEELAKLIRAEVVTQYPDTRQNPNEEINWDEMGENDFQGIIKFKRASESENTTTMVYTDQETFQGYIDEYNNTGSETAKQNALTHFTLKKSSVSDVSGNETTVVAAGEGVMTDVSQKIIDAINKTGWPGKSRCLQWVDDVYENAGLTVTRKTSAYEAYKAYCISTDKSAIPVGATVYGTGSGTAGGAYGHVGIYIGDGKVVDSVSDGINTSTLEEWIGWQENCAINDYNQLKDINGKDQHGWLGWGWADGNKIRGTTQDTNIIENNSDNTEDDNNNETQQVPTQTAVLTNVSGDGYSQEYTSSAGITYKLFKQGKGSYKDNKYWKGTIHNNGCGPTSVAILASGLTNLNYTPKETAKEMDDKYGYTSAVNLKKEMDSLGLASEIKWNPTAEDIQNNLRNGKVMLVSVTGKTIFTNQTHIMTILDINTDGQVFIGNPGGKTNDWYDISDVMKGCQYIVVTDAGAAGIASATNTSRYVATVATWTQVDTTIESTDPNVENTANTEYFMTTTDINYQAMVQPYSMPFDLLWAFLVIGDEKEFVFELADLVYNSDIQITIYDNLTVDTNINDWNYSQRTRAILKYYEVTANLGENKEYESLKDHIEDPYVEENYNTVKTVVTQTNTINAVLTKANTWAVDYTNNCTYETKETKGDPQEIKQDDTEYPQQADSSANTFTCEHTEEIKQKLLEKLKNNYNANIEHRESGLSSSTTDVNFVENCYVEYFKKYSNITNKITTKTVTKEYTTGVPEIKEKTDASVDENDEPKELNFVTIFRKAEHIQNRRNTLSVPSWLFEIVETNDSTKDMLDLVKYLLYKASGTDYGVTEWSFDDLFTMKESVIFGELIGNDNAEKIWNFLIGKGFSEEATAGVMGNINAESGFDPGAVNPNSGARGICQWLDPSPLKTFARNHGRNWLELEVQLEYLVSNMPSVFDGWGSGSICVSNGKMISGWPTKVYFRDFKAIRDIEDATRKFASIYERFGNQTAEVNKRIGFAKAIYNQYHK